MTARVYASPPGESSGGRLTKDEHQQLLDAVKEDGTIDAVENEQVTRVLNMVREGQLTVE
jgi:hypothetical protein